MKPIRLTIAMATAVAIIAPLNEEPVLAGDACVTRAEFVSTRMAWQTEGMTRAGARANFGIDGHLTVTGA